MSKHKDLTIAFFGTPDLAVYVLEELEYAGIVPMVVVTPPDKPAGRKLTLAPPAVKVWAEVRDIPVLQPLSLRNREDVPELANTPFDLCIVAAYNYMIPPWLLALPRYRVLNVHPSLLPKLRGPSPIRSAIMQDARDAVGVSIIVLDDEMDHGPIVAQATVELPEWPVRGTVLDEVLFREGGRLLAEAIPLWCAGQITPDEQVHANATFTKKMTKVDGLINLSDDPYINYRKFCAFDGWPGVHTFVSVSRPNGTTDRVRIKITDASYTQGTFTILRVIPEGKPEMLWEDWCRNVGLQ